MRTRYGEVIKAYLSAYEEHKQQSGSLKHLIGNEYVLKMEERVKYQMERARELIAIYRDINNENNQINT